MTVQYDSQPVTDKIMYYIVAFIIIFPVQKRRRLVGTHDQTYYVHFNVRQITTVCFSPLQ